MKIQKKGKRIKFNISAKLLTASLFFAVVPLIIVCSFSINNFSKTIKKENIASMQANTDNKLKQLEAVMDGEKQHATAIAYNDDIIEILSSIVNDSSGKVDAVQQGKIKNYLLHFADQSNEMYESLYITDTKGKIVATSADGDTSDIDLSTRDYFLAARDTGDAVISDVVTSSLTGNTIVVIAVPLFDSNNNFLGILGIPMNFTKLTNNIIQRNDGEIYNYIIFNKDGLVIAHENQDLVFKSNMNSEGPTQKALFEKMIKDAPSYGFYSRTGVKKAMTYAKYDENGWYIACAVTEKDYLQPINTLIKTIIITILVCIILITTIALFFSRSISKPIIRISKAAEAIAEGNLTYVVKTDKSKDEIGVMTAAFSKMVDNLKTITSDVRLMGKTTAQATQEMMISTKEVSLSATQMAAAVNELAKGASEQAISTEKGNNKIKEVISGLNEITTQMSASNNLADLAKKTVDSGKLTVVYQKNKMQENKDVINNVAVSIDSLNENSKEIEGILSVIMGISEQTNLLSLNAAIEAARAGEQGKGFAVVADEIRKLAEQSGVSVKKIDSIIREVQNGVKTAVSEMIKAKEVVNEQERAIAETVTTFTSIENAVMDINLNIKKVTEVSTQLDIKASEAGIAMEDIASIAEETAAGAEEIAASTEEQTTIIQQISESSKNLNQLSGDLEKSIEFFKS